MHRDLKLSERRSFRLEEPRRIRAGFYADISVKFGLRQIQGSDDPQGLWQIDPAPICRVQRTLICLNFIE